jgi:small GTP-binding protein
MTNIKVVLLGQASVGKSCLVTRLIKNMFYETMIETIGASFALYQTPEAKFEIWDTAGQERYAPISRMYYANADIIIVVFDISSTASWKRVNELLYEVRQYNITGHFIIVGNKIDLRTTIPFETWIHPNLNDLERNIVYLSSKTGANIELLKHRLHHYSKMKSNPIRELDLIDLDETQYNNCIC